MSGGGLSLFSFVPFRSFHDRVPFRSSPHSPSRAHLPPALISLPHSSTPPLPCRSLIPFPFRSPFALHPLPFSPPSVPCPHFLTLIKENTKRR